MPVSPPPQDLDCAGRHFSVPIVGGRTTWRTLGVVALLLLLLIGLTGCMSSPFGLEFVKGQKQAGLRLPAGYVPLKVPNACFVESVHFFDTYLNRNLGGHEGWVRVLQWSDRQDDYTLQPGHAVAVFTARGRLWLYDVNHGLLPLTTSVARRGDETEILPQIAPRYPHYRPVLVSYSDDIPRAEPPATPPKLPDGPPGASELAAVGAAAQVLGRTRPVRIVEFDVQENGRKGRGAALAFLFGTQLCVYIPSAGTQAHRAYVAGLDDLRTIARIIRTRHPSASGFGWYSQP